MIISRTPLRISIGGGGTDLPSYYRRFGGFVISAAINKHIYVSINERFSSGYLLKYSALEQASELEEIRHPLIRETLRLYDVQPPIEVVSMADIPAGTGLGSSGAFTVGLLLRCKIIHTENLRVALIEVPGRPLYGWKRFSLEQKHHCCQGHFFKCGSYRTCYDETVPAAAKTFSCRPVSGGDE